MKRPLLFILALLILGSVSYGSSAFAAGELVHALEKRKTFMETPSAKRADWLLLITEFEKAAAAQKYARHASRARYLAAELAFLAGQKFNIKSDLQKSSRLARQSVKDCSTCSHSAAAQLISGQALLTLGELDQADKELLKVELNYPNSLNIAEARRLRTQIHGSPPPKPASENPQLPQEKQSPAATKVPAIEGQSPRAEIEALTENNSESTASNSPAPPTAETPTTKNTTAVLEQTPEKPTAPQAFTIPPMPTTRADGLAQVYFMTLEDAGSHTRATAYLDKTVPYVYNLIPPRREGAPFRAYADLKTAVLSPKFKVERRKTPLVKLLKATQFNKDTVRLVLDLPKAHPYHPVFYHDPPRFVFYVSQNAENLPPPRLETQVAVEPKEVPETAQAPLANKAPQGPKESLARQLGLKVKTVVIDPGHGGKDSGAFAYNIKEKDIVLKLAKKLQRKLDEEDGLSVYLTRDDDRFITLENRTKFAKEKRADLFISLHINANTLAKVEGFETYILNFATDPSAMAVAARENASVNKSVAELDSLLNTIAKNTKIAESRAMAQLLHKTTLRTLRSKHQVRDLGVKEAPFYVLVGTEIPSILVEIGFLTNKKESELLTDDAYLELIAEGLTNGLTSYINSLGAGG